MPATPTWRPESPGLVEVPESGEYNLAESQTFTQIFTGKYEDCVAGALAKGTYGSGDTEGYMVQSCRVSRDRGLIGKLVIVWVLIEITGENLPADEFGLNPQDQSPATERNPAFNNVTSEQFEKVRTAVFTSEETAKPAREWIEALGSSTSNNETKALYAQLKRGVTNYYKPFFTYYWAQYFTSIPSVNTGAYIEAPGGPLESTIAGLSLTCLRQADNLEFQNGLYKRTRAWMCTTDAYWDSILYP